MKRISLSLMLTVLLMATLCLAAAAQNWEHDKTLRPNTGQVNGLVFVDEGETLISASGSWLARWNLNTGTQTHARNVGSTIHSIAVPHDSYPGEFATLPFFVAYGKADGKIGMRFTANLCWRGGFTHGTGPVTALAFAPASYSLFSGEESQQGPRIKSWDLRQPTADPQTDVRHIADRTRVWDLAVPLDWHLQRSPSNTVLSADGDNNVDAWRLSNGGLEGFTFPWFPLQSVRSVAANYGYIAGGDSGGEFVIHIWEADIELAPVTFLEGHTDSVNVLAFSPDDPSILASGSDDNDVHVWDITDGSYELLAGHTGDVTAIAFSPHGYFLASGSADGTIRIWRNLALFAAPAANSQVELPTAKQTALFANYPNPFNPETWIPYQLAEPAEVTVSIHAADGTLVRTLALGQRPAGVYSEKERAAHWDGRNELGEPVASGVYFYTLKAGEFLATKKMLIRK